MNPNTKRLIILVVLLVIFAVLAVRAGKYWKQSKPVEFDVVIYYCPYCEKETLISTQQIARPACSYCGRMDGTWRREKRQQPE